MALFLPPRRRGDLAAAIAVLIRELLPLLEFVAPTLMSNSPPFPRENSDFALEPLDDVDTDVAVLRLGDDDVDVAAPVRALVALCKAISRSRAC